MTRFPALEGKEVVAVLEKHVFFVERQRGKPLYCEASDGRAAVVPLHAGETIGPRLFAKILRDTDLKREVFLREQKRKKKV